MRRLRSVWECRQLRPRVRPALWALFEIPGDDPLWMPFSARDVVLAARTAAAMFRLAGVRAGDIVLSVTPGGPWAGNLLPYLLTAADSLVDGTPLGAEVLPLSALTVSFRPDLTIFPLRRGPSVLLGRAEDVDAVLAHARAAGAPEIAPRLSLLYGQDGNRDRDGAAEHVALLYVPGLLAPCGGAPGRRGVRIPPEAAVTGLIPDEAWARSVAIPGTVPEVLAAPSARGRAGELVVTPAADALPAVALRTQLRVEVIDVDADGSVWVEPRLRSRV